jgi:hypothetical protein
VSLPGSSGAEVAALCLMPALASVVLGVLGFRAAARRVDDRVVSPLTHREAVLATIVASLVCSLTVLVGRGSDHERGGLTFATLGMMVLPLAALLVARVPATQGDMRRDIDLSSLMRELAVFTSIHLGVVLVLSPTSLVYAAGGMLHALWAVAVTGLTALRLLSPGNRWLVGAWGGLCLLCAAIMMVNGYELVGGSSRAELFAMYSVSPLLGAMQLACVFVIPILLVRGIRRAARS